MAARAVTTCTLGTARDAGRMTTAAITSDRDDEQVDVADERASHGAAGDVAVDAQLGEVCGGSHGPDKLRNPVRAREVRSRAKSLTIRANSSMLKGFWTNVTSLALMPRRVISSLVYPDIRIALHPGRCAPGFGPARQRR